MELAAAHFTQSSVIASAEAKKVEPHFVLREVTQGRREEHRLVVRMRENEDRFSCSVCAYACTLHGHFRESIRAALQQRSSRGAVLVAQDPVPHHEGEAEA